MLDKKKLLILIAVFVVIVLFVFFMVRSNANASAEPIVCEGQGQGQDQEGCISPTPQEPTVTPICGEWEEDCITPTQEVTPSATPEATTTPEVTGGQGVVPDNPQSDGKSDGRSSCPSCTAAPNMPSSPPSTGRAER